MILSCLHLVADQEPLARLASDSAQMLLFQGYSKKWRLFYLFIYLSFSYECDLEKIFYVKLHLCSNLLNTMYNRNTHHIFFTYFLFEELQNCFFIFTYEESHTLVDIY